MTIYVEIANERIRQDSKWGGPEVDDSRKTQEDWCDDIITYTTWAQQMARWSPERYRRRMMQVAALAVAACESFDRIAEKRNEH